MEEQNKGCARMYQACFPTKSTTIPGRPKSTCSRSGCGDGGSGSGDGSGGGSRDVVVLAALAESPRQPGSPLAPAY